MKILGFVGSLRKGSYNRIIYNEFVRRLPTGFDVEEGYFGDWPLYNKDVEQEQTPPAVMALKQKIAAADSIVFATPEYNRSIPGGLKNMLDWTSRDPMPWAGRKVFVMGVSSGDRGAVMSQYDLKRVLMYFGCHVLGQPEFYLNYNGKFDEAGKLVDAKVAERLDTVASKFVEFVQKS